MPQVRTRLVGWAALAAVLVVACGGAPPGSPAVPSASAGSTARAIAPSASPEGGSPAPTASGTEFHPNIIALDPVGGLVVTDCQAARVYRITNGRQSTIAGSGPGMFAAGFTGDGGPATAAQLQCPYGVAFDRHQVLFVADHGNQRIRAIDRDGVIRTVAGSGPHGDATGGFSGDGGPATKARLSEPTWLVFDAHGNLDISDRDNNRVRQLTSDGRLITIAGTGEPGFGGDGGPATSATLDGPAGLAIDASGSLYIADSVNRRIRVVGPDGRIRTFAGTGTDGSTGDGGRASAATFGDPEGLAMDRTGTLYVGDGEVDRVRLIEPGGVIRAFAGRVDESGPVAGAGGPAVDAVFGPDAALVGLAIGSDGTVYIADEGNQQVWVVARDGTLSTVPSSP